MKSKSTVRVSTTIDKELKGLLEEIAIDKGLSLNILLSLILRQYVVMGLYDDEK